jgi:hypothetical protein
VHKIDPSHGFEQFGGKVSGTAGSGGAYSHFSRIRLGECNQLCQRVYFHLRIHQDHIGHGDQLRDGRQIGLYVVWQVLAQRRLRGNTCAGDQQRVTVTGCRCDDPVADGSARSGPVVDHDRHLVLLGQPGRDLARDHVGSAARGEWHHKCQRLARDRLGEHDRGCSHCS